jgi:hypothetical protein
MKKSTRKKLSSKTARPLIGALALSEPEAIPLPTPPGKLPKTVPYDPDNPPKWIV